MLLEELVAAGGEVVKDDVAAARRGRALGRRGAWRSARTSAAGARTATR